MSIYPLEILDRFVTKLTAKSFFTGFTATTNNRLQVQPETIPFLGVYLLEPIEVPDGDANAGPIKFRCAARYGISVIIQNNDPTVARQKLTTALGVICAAIYEDPTVYNWGGAGAKIQGFMRERAVIEYGSVGKDNEIPIAELQFELVCDLGEIFYYPTEFDDLHLIHVRSEWPSAAKAPDTQQVVAEWDVST